MNNNTDNNLVSYTGRDGNVRTISATAIRLFLLSGNTVDINWSNGKLWERFIANSAGHENSVNKIVVQETNGVMAGVVRPLESAVTHIITTLRGSNRNITINGSDIGTIAERLKFDRIGTFLAYTV